MLAKEDFIQTLVLLKVAFGADPVLALCRAEQAWEVLSEHESAAKKSTRQRGDVHRPG